MRALVLDVARQVRGPDRGGAAAPEGGEALCKIRAVAICGSDPEIIRGDLAGTWPPSYPFIPGHEWAGEVRRSVPAWSISTPAIASPARPIAAAATAPTAWRGATRSAKTTAGLRTGHRHYGFIVPGAYASTRCIR